MTKYQDLKNKVKRSRKLKNTKVVPVIVGASGMMMKNVTEILKTIPGNITPNKLHLEAVFITVAEAEKGIYFRRYPYRRYNKLGLVSF